MPPMVSLWFPFLWQAPEIAPPGERGVSCTAIDVGSPPPPGSVVVLSVLCGLWWGSGQIAANWDYDNVQASDVSSRATV